MSQPGAVGDHLELSEIDSWPHNHADEEPHGTVSRNYQEHHRMSSSGSAAGSSTAFDPLEAPKTWKEWLDRALRINKAAGDMTRARAVTLVLLSFFFVLTTSLLVTGFQGLLPALLRDGVRLCFSLVHQTAHLLPHFYLVLENEKVSTRHIVSPAFPSH